MKRKLGFILVTFIFWVVNLNRPAQADLLITDEIPEIPVVMPEDPEVYDNSEGPQGAKELTQEQMEEQKYITDLPLVPPMIIRYEGWMLEEYPIFEPKTSYYSGPAAVQSVLTFFNVFAPNRNTIAEACGMKENEISLESMKDYINSRQSAKTYVVEHGLSQTQMADRMYFNIFEYKAPSVLGLTFNENGYWDYSTNGQFLSIYGVDSTQSRFVLADPWIYKADSLQTLGYYDQPVEVLYEVYSRRDMGLIR